LSAVSVNKHSETAKTVTAKLANRVHVTRIQGELLTALPRPLCTHYPDNAASAWTCCVLQALLYSADRLSSKM